MVLAPEPEIKPLVNDQILPWSLAPPIIVAESKSWERRDVPGPLLSTVPMECFEEEKPGVGAPCH